MYRSLCFVFFCISVVVTERLNYPPIQVIGDEATLQHIEARRLMSIAEVERLDNLELLARERVALEQERQQSASQLFRRLREETEAEMLFEEAKLEALSAEEQSPISRTRENERELLEPAGVYDNYDQGYGQSPYNSNNNNNRYNDDSRFPNSNENVGSGYPSNNGNVGYNHPSTSNNYGNNLPSNNNNNYGNNYPRNTNNNYGNSNNNNYDNSYPGGNSYPSGNANYDNSYPNNLNDNRYPGNTNMNQNNNRHPIGSGSGSWGNSNNNNIGTGSGGWGNNNNGQWGNNGGRGQVCCQSCHTGTPTSTYHLSHSLHLCPR